jgi:hypothetical protein
VVELLLDPLQQQTVIADQTLYFPQSLQLVVVMEEVVIKTVQLVVQVVVLEEQAEQAVQARLTKDTAAATLTKVEAAVEALVQQVQTTRFKAKHLEATALHRQLQALR